MKDKKLKIIRRFVFCFLILLATSCLLLTTSYAQDTFSKQSITVFPAIIDLNVKPDEKTRFLLQFRNGGEIPVAGVIKVADFTVKDKDGTPILLENEPEKPIYAASNWIRTDTTQLTIPANDFVAVYFNAAVPEIVKTCGNYALVYFESEATAPLGVSKTTTNSSSAVATKIGALINFTVKEKTCKEGATISNLQYPTLSENGPVKVTFEIINQGDYHIAPVGTVYVANMINSRTDEQIIPEKRIFPGVLKEYQLSLGKKWMLGRYQFVINGKYGLNNLPVTASAYFWVFPWRLAIVILLAIILLTLLGKNYFDQTISKEKHLEEEIVEEKEEIEKLKQQLKKGKE